MPAATHRLTGRRRLGPAHPERECELRPAESVDNDRQGEPRLPLSTFGEVDGKEGTWRDTIGGMGAIMHGQRLWLEQLSEQFAAVVGG